MGFGVEQNKIGGIEHICQELRDYCPGIVHKLIIHSVEYIAYCRSIAVSLNLGHILRAIVYTMWGGGFFEKYLQCCSQRVGVRELCLTGGEAYLGQHQDFSDQE